MATNQQLTEEIDALVDEISALREELDRALRDQSDGDRRVLRRWAIEQAVKIASPTHEQKPDDVVIETSKALVEYVWPTDTVASE